MSYDFGTLPEHLTHHLDSPTPPPDGVLVELAVRYAMPTGAHSMLRWVVVKNLFRCSDEAAIALCRRFNLWHLESLPGRGAQGESPDQPQP